MIIFGAGLAGLLAGSVFQTATILEASPKTNGTHKAVLRFRSRAVADATGIDFRQVTVRKGIWYNEGFTAPTIQLANWYSQKVIGSLCDRSIWNLEPVERYIAPETLIEQLIQRCSGRIEWETPVTASTEYELAISTMPMPVTLKMAQHQPWLQAYSPQPFTYAPITVKRWTISNADVFQTVYFPEPDTTLYRVSITKDLVIAEYMGEPDDYDFFRAFGVHLRDATFKESAKQRFGKIAPIDEAWRKQFIFDLTTHLRIYSLGRFATWRNILLDDVIHDINVIKRMMAGSAYDRRRLS